MADDFGIDLEDYANDQEKAFESQAIDMSDYAQSEEAQQASWWDTAKESVIQAGLGTASAFTWPISLVKYGMVQNALGDLDEVEERYRKQGKEFDRNEMIKTITDKYDFVPTQEDIAQKFTEKTGIETKPKTETGKRINQFFRLFSMAKGGFGGATQATLGTAATEALKQVGVSEGKAELIGDIGSGFGNIKSSPRQLSKEAGEIEATAAKHQLPFPEYLARGKEGIGSAKITEARKAALQRQLGMDSEEAIEKVIEGKLPVAKLKNQGVDIELLKNDAYDKVGEIAKKIPGEFDKSSIFSDIDNEIARIQSIAPSLSSDSKKSIELLEKAKKELEASPSTIEQMVNQIKEWNKDTKNIYRKPEFSGSEDAVRKTYAFLNDTTRNAIEAKSPELRSSMRAADQLNTQVKRLEHAENMLSKAFQNGEYSPKKLDQVLNSRQGQIVKRELGEDAIKDIRDIAKYGDAAVQATNQLAKSTRYAGELTTWGPIAGFLFAKLPKTAALAIALRPAADHIRGYLMQNPATRTVYKDIMKNAAQGSFRNMQADFAKLEKSISDEYGSVDNFLQSVYDDLEVVEGFD